MLVQYRTLLAEGLHSFSKTGILKVLEVFSENPALSFDCWSPSLTYRSSDKLGCVAQDPFAGELSSSFTSSVPFSETLVTVWLCSKAFLHTFEKTQAALCSALYDAECRD